MRARRGVIWWALASGLTTSFVACAPAGTVSAPASPEPAPTGPAEDPANAIVARLSDPAEVDSAILELVEEYQTLRNEGSDLELWVEQYAEALTTAYTDHFDKLRPEARRRLVQLLGEVADPLTEPALQMAVEAFTDNRLSGLEVDLECAARAQQQLKLETLREPLFAAFQALRAHTEAGKHAYQAVGQALVSSPASEWVPTLREIVAAPMPLPNEDPAAYADQLFWQTVATRLLGILGDGESARRLMRVVLDPAKSEMGTTAVLALVKLGPAGVAPATAVLDGKDTELLAFHRTQMSRIDPPGDGRRTAQRDDHVLLAAVVLGAAGQSTAVDAFERALRGARDGTERAVLLRELAKLPPTERTQTAFQNGYQRVTLDVRMPPAGSVALAELAAEAVPRFYEPKLVPWVLQRARHSYGDPVSQADHRRAALATAIKLAQLDQLELIEPLIQPWGAPLDSTQASNPQSPRLERGLLNDTKTLLERCQDDLACYLDTVEDPALQSPQRRFVAIRAAYQLGIVGNGDTAGKLATRLVEVDSAAVRFAVVQAIDHLLPAGAPAIGKQLEATAPPGADGDAIREVAYRIRGRALAPK